MIAGETRAIKAVLRDGEAFEVTALTASVWNAATGDALSSPVVGATSAAGWAGQEPEGECYVFGASFQFAPDTAGDYLWSITGECADGQTLTAEGVVKVLPTPPSLPAYRMAKQRLRIETESGTFPCLTDDDLDELLADAALATTWADSTAYTFGAVVVPTVGNGTLWRATKAGTSGSTEPTWPALCDVGPAFGYTAAMTDGTVTWDYAGRAPVTADGLWDIRAAVSAGWARKAGRALSLDMDPITDAEGKVTIPNQAREREQIRAHCMAMAERNVPLFVR